MSHSRFTTLGDREADVIDHNGTPESVAAAVMAAYLAGSLWVGRLPRPRVQDAGPVRHGRIGYRWRGAVSDEELTVLTESHGGRSQPGWWDRVRPHSLG